MHPRLSRQLRYFHLNSALTEVDGHPAQGASIHNANHLSTDRDTNVFPSILQCPSTLGLRLLVCRIEGASDRTPTQPCNLMDLNGASKEFESQAEDRNRGKNVNPELGYPLQSRTTRGDAHGFIWLTAICASPGSWFGAHVSGCRTFRFFGTNGPSLAGVFAGHRGFGDNTGACDWSNAGHTMHYTPRS